MKKTLSLNMITSLILQLVTLISGLIIPRLILNVFGSEVNGLISSINQLLNYVSLLEGGVASVMMASLYTPLYDNNQEKLSSIVKTITHFFRKLAIIFLIYQVLLAVFYPILINTRFSWAYVSSLTLILGINLFIQYNFSITYRLLLNADNKIYITSIVQIIVIILNTILVYIGINLYPNIHFIKLITSLIFIIQPICYHHYIDKFYNLDKNVCLDNACIKQRWDGFGINLAAFIHNNTDVLILTVLTNLKTVSVYSVYLLVINGVKSLLISILSSFIPTLGRLIAKKDINELNSFFDLYEFFSMSINFLAYTLTSILILPFIMIYTKNMTDTNYFQPIFAILMIIAELLYCIREPYINMAYKSGHFTQIRKYAYIESILNLVISITLATKFGLIGVAIGTLISIAYRTFMHVVYIKNNLLMRKVHIFIKYFFVFSTMSIVIYTIVINILNIYNYSLINFLLITLGACLISIIIYFFTMYIFYRPNLLQIKSFIFKKKD